MLYLLTGELNFVTENRHIWIKWVETLHRWGMQETAAVVIEAAEPLSYLGAQAVYVGQPFLNAVFPKEHVSAFADLLESPENAQSFTQLLKAHKREG